MMNASDNQGKLPAIIDKTNHPNWTYWYQDMQDYMPSALDGKTANYAKDSSSILRCPSKSKDDAYTWPDYAPNSAVFTRYLNLDGTITSPGPRLSSLSNPSITVLLMDALGSAMEITSSRTNPTYLAGEGCWAAYERHLNGVNVLFADGHVEYMKSPGAGNTLDVEF